MPSNRLTTPKLVDFRACLYEQDNNFSKQQHEFIVKFPFNHIT